jgi:outer membrane protein
MKNGMLIGWNIILTVLAGVLLFLFLGNRKKQPVSIAVRDDPQEQPAQPTRIAYINMDSVQENYAFAKEILDDIRRIEQDNNFRLEKLSDDYNKTLQSYMQQDQQAGLQQLSEVHQQDLMERQKRISDQKQSLEQDYVKKVGLLEQSLRDKIKTYLKDYNKDKKYAYIMSLEERMFYYVDTVYDVTVDVVKGLNEQHKTTKKK